MMQRMRQTLGRIRGIRPRQVLENPVVGLVAFVAVALAIGGIFTLFAGSDGEGDAAVVAAADSTPTPAASPTVTSSNPTPAPTTTAVPEPTPTAAPAPTPKPEPTATPGASAQTMRVGFVQSECNGSPVTGASVRITDAAGEVVVSGETTDQMGQVLMRASAGTYAIMLTTESAQHTWRAVEIAPPGMAFPLRAC